jgi:hypothetical protein
MNYKPSTRTPQKRKTLADLRPALKEVEPSNAGMVHTKKQQLAETLLKRLKYLDNLLNSPNVRLESIREAQREKTQIYDGIAD